MTALRTHWQKNSTVDLVAGRGAVFIGGTDFLGGD